jgi:hypothetical protein
MITKVVVAIVGCFLASSITAIAGVGGGNSQFAGGWEVTTTYPGGSFVAGLDLKSAHEGAASCLTVSVRSSLDLYSCDVGQNAVTEIGYIYNRSQFVRGYPPLARMYRNVRDTSSIHWRYTPVNTLSITHSRITMHREGIRS